VDRWLAGMVTPRGISDGEAKVKVAHRLPAAEQAPWLFFGPAAHPCAPTQGGRADLSPERGPELSPGFRLHLGEEAPGVPSRI
jgi:hypothetical protein